MSSKTTSSKATIGYDGYPIVPATTSYAAISFNEATDICRADASNVSSDINGYVSANGVSYYILINLWLFQVDRYCRDGCFVLLEALKSLGLIAVIKLCSEAADVLIGHMLVNSIDAAVDSSIAFVSHVLREVQGDDRIVLQLLRFPKRFSPARADLIEKASIQSFKSINKKCKVGNKCERSYYWVDRIRCRIADILRGFSVDYNKGFFSAGVAADADRPLANKLMAYSAIDPCLYHDALYAIGRHKKKIDDLFYTAIVRAVPKSYKSARIIAMEHAYRQFHLQAIRMELERCIERNGYLRNLNLHSQEANQVAAWEGSFNPTYATIDLSSASDSLERGFAYSVLPLGVCMELEKYLPRFFMVGNSVSRMHMFCTSGSAVTFPIESIIFLAIAMEVTEVCSNLTGDHYVEPIVFGDDILVDQAVYDTMVEVLKKLRFTVNATKSYGWDSRYRESCGVEYLDGVALSTKYWPRSTVSFTAGSIATAIGQLCSIQHSLYELPRASIFLKAAVRALEPRMTSHYPGVECQDLWDAIPTFRTAYAPVGDSSRVWTSDEIKSHLRGCTEHAMREVHLAMKTRRRNKGHIMTTEGFTFDSLVETWLYAKFLKDGPTYDDETSRLAGVSSKPPTRASLCDTGEVYWDWVKE